MVAIDTLHIAGGSPWFSSRWNAAAWEALWEGKRQARDAQCGGVWLDEEIAGHAVRVRSGAAGRGKRHLPLVLELFGGDVVLMLSGSRVDLGAFRPVANVRAEIGGRACVLHGAERCLDAIAAVLKALGGAYDPRHFWATRVDVCVDLPGESMDPYERAVRAGKVASKALGDLTVIGPRGDVRQIACGKSNRLRASIYDKAKKVRADAAAGTEGKAYRAAMIATRWGGVDREQAVRVEFQAGRAWLREQKFLRLPDLLGGLRRFCELATRDRHPFFKLTARPVDRENRNHGRAGTARIWARVCKAFRAWAGWADQPEAPPPGEIAASNDPKRELRTATSHFVKALTGVGVFIAGEDPLGQIAAKWDEIRRSPAAADLAARANAKGVMYRARLGLGQGRPAPAG